MSKEVIQKQLDASVDLLSLKNLNFARGNNFLFKNGEFTSRKGISTDEKRIMFDYMGRAYATVIPTDTYIFYDGKRANVAIVREWEDIEDIYKVYRFKLVFADGTVKDIGSIDFSGFSPGTSAEPTSYIIYSGKSIKGGGLFFIVNKYYQKTDTNVVGIYEISRGFDSWIALQNEDMYAPTVFFNGQGESCYIAKFNDPNFQLPTPQFLESKNLLTGAFKSYFTTDGYSFAFTLPYDNLTNEVITCGYSLDEERYYEWTIKEGHSTSQQVSIGEEKIELYCDREKGRMVFTKPSGELFHLEKSNTVNNIWFKAYKSNDNDALKVASMSIAHTFPGKSNYSAMTVVSGSDLYPSEVLWFDSNNPLYFPDSCRTNMGDIKEKIIALSLQNGKLLAFSQTKLFKGRFVSASGYNLKGILAGVKGSGSIKESSIVFDLVGELPDTPVEKTIKQTDSKTFFGGKNGGVYCFNEKGNDFHQISPKGSFADLLFAVLDYENYMLFTNSSGFVLSQTEDFKKSVWYEQKYPVKILGGANVDVGAIYFASVGGEYAPLLYNFSLNGEEDVFFSKQDDEETVLNRKRINSCLELELEKEGFTDNRLVRLKADAKSHYAADIVLKNGGTPFYSRTTSDINSGIDILGGGVFSRLFVFMKFRGIFSLKGVSFFYRKLKK